MREHPAGSGLGHGRGGLWPMVALSVAGVLLTDVEVLLLALVVWRCCRLLWPSTGFAPVLLAVMALYVATDVLALSLCRASRRGDRMAARLRGEADDER